jgi:hypothetical protein
MLPLIFWLGVNLLILCLLYSAFTWVRGWLRRRDEPDDEEEEEEQRDEENAKLDEMRAKLDEENAERDRMKAVQAEADVVEAEMKAILAENPPAPPWGQVSDDATFTPLCLLFGREGYDEKMGFYFILGLMPPELPEPFRSVPRAILAFIDAKGHSSETFGFGMQDLDELIAWLANARVTIDKRLPREEEQRR